MTLVTYILLATLFTIVIIDQIELHNCLFLTVFFTHLVYVMIPVKVSILLNRKTFNAFVYVSKTLEKCLLLGLFDLVKMLLGERQHVDKKGQNLRLFLCVFLENKEYMLCTYVLTLDSLLASFYFDLTCQ